MKVKLSGCTNNFSEIVKVLLENSCVSDQKLRPLINNKNCHFGAVVTITYI